MSQGINREYIFEEEEDKNKYMKIIKKTKEEIEITILAYCIMNNHVHILFYTNDVRQITKFMHKVNLVYAKYYNKKYKRIGYVFRDRFKTQPICTERYLYTCVKYIHNNPVKANLCKNAQEYKYSSSKQNEFYGGTDIEKSVRKIMCIDDTQKEERFAFLEVEKDKEKICKEAFEGIMIQKNIRQEDLKKNKQVLIDIVRILKNDYKISFRTMEKVLGIGRETLRQIIS